MEKGSDGYMSILLWVMLAMMTVIGYFCNGAIGNHALIGNFLVSVVLILAWGYYIAFGIKSKCGYKITLGYCFLIFAAAMIQLVLSFNDRNSILWTVCSMLIAPFQGMQYIASSALQFYAVVGVVSLTGIAGSIYKLWKKETDKRQ